MKRYALFLGCTVPVRAQHYELATRNVAKELGIEFVDLKEGSCCGFPLKALDAETSLLMAARNVGLASNLGLDVVTLCNSCTAMLSDAQVKLKESEFRKKFTELGFTYPNEIKVRHFVRVLYEDIGVEDIKKAIRKPLNNLRIISHYGCHYLRPSYLHTFDSVENPHTLDELTGLTGATVIDYQEKKLCCGGSVLGVDEELAVKMANQKLSIAKNNNADVLISICPFCTVMYEDNQRKVEAKFNTTYNIPVLYYPQLLGLSLGLPPDACGLKFNRIKPDNIISKL
ncbi:MAG: CoB--CoM heterodisulfide reductase iron-sulfur subunit B family protein [candidate division WOR-3 bacterium]|nr:CoB--CoM heterodisulfide reductase iron-sulfur subunit B family protein [candidate division WOR-3 bacterium]